MAQAGFLEPRKMRPGAAAIVVLMHGAALTALMMAKGYMPSPNDIFIETKVIDINEPDPPPPPPPPPRTDRPLEQVTNLTTVPRPTPLPSPFQLPPAPPSPPPDLGALPSNQNVAGIVEQPPAPPPPAPPPAPPVRRDAVMISGDLQPPYPTSEQHAAREGTVVIRVTVGTDGRVKATEKVRATSDAFYEATERHARARWRFRPATVDGEPAETRKTLTVHFRLDES